MMIVFPRKRPRLSKHETMSTFAVIFSIKWCTMRKRHSVSSCTCGYEERGGDGARVPPALAALSTNDVYARCQGVLGVLGCAHMQTASQVTSSRARATSHGATGTWCTTYTSQFLKGNAVPYSSRQCPQSAVSKPPNQEAPGHPAFKTNFSIKNHKLRCSPRRRKRTSERRCRR